MPGFADLFQRKITILEEVLNITNGATFKGDDSDVDVYSELMEKRDVLLEESKAIDIKLEAFEKTGEHEKERREFKAKVAVLARKIIEQDNYMAEAVSKIFATVKQDIKGMNATKNLNNAYNNFSIGGSTRDWKK